MESGRPSPRSSVLAASAWMLFVSLLLFWLPFVGPLIGGVVGGRKAGEVGRAIMAAFLPAILLAIAMFLSVSLLTAVPLIGVVAGFGAFALIASNIGPLLLGAIVGALAPAR